MYCPNRKLNCARQSATTAKIPAPRECGATSRRSYSPSYEGFCRVLGEGGKQVENIALNLAEQSRNAALEFVKAVDVKVAQLEQFPESGVIYEDDVRRLLLRPAPFSLFYIFDDSQNTATIIACFHDRSGPGNWRF
ncbi:type II toxin-antitoxin system RelE/ParE family toxin [bacterium]|nr:MAG: type II toxin-antitoxin system RelE/ParE family toxin [bacterium]